MSSLTSATPTQRVSGPARPGRARDGARGRVVTDRPAGAREPAVALHAGARLQRLPGALREGGGQPPRGVGLYAGARLPQLPGTLREGGRAPPLVLGCAGQGARHHLVHTLRPGDGYLTRHSLDQVVSRRAVERV